MSLLSYILKKTSCYLHDKAVLRAVFSAAMAASAPSAAQETSQTDATSQEPIAQSTSSIANDPQQELVAVPSLDDVFAEICAAGILYPDIVMSQVQLETGKLTNKMLMSRNNLFGFRFKTYLSFARWQDSVSYYKRWQDRKYLNKNEDYFKFLHRIRYASGNYKQHVLRFKWNKNCSQIG